MERVYGVVDVVDAVEEAVVVVWWQRWSWRWKRGRSRRSKEWEWE